MRKILAISALLMMGSLVGQEMQLDTQGSSIEWKGERKILNKGHTGTIAFKSGSVTVENGKLTGGEFIVDMKSMKESNGANRLIGHLMSDDFFSVDTYPTAMLAIKSVGKVKEGMVEITADLTIKATTEEITFPAQVEIKDGKFMGSAELSFDRAKFDIRYGSGSFFDDLGDKVIADENPLKVTISAN